MRNLLHALMHRPDTELYSALQFETPDEEARWSLTDHLLASTVDALQSLIYVQVKSKGGDLPEPKPVTRPRLIAERSSMSDILALFGQIADVAEGE